MRRVRTIYMLFLLALGLCQSLSASGDSLLIFPNPFCDSATIRIHLDQADSVSLRVYNISGYMVDAIVQDSFLTAGEHDFNFIPGIQQYGVFFVVFIRGTNNPIEKKMIFICNETAISSLANPTSVQFSPNPTTGLLHIPISGMKIIRIADNKGCLLKEIKSSEQTIFLADLDQGIYFVSVFSNEGSLLTKQKIFRINEE